MSSPLSFGTYRPEYGARQKILSSFTEGFVERRLDSISGVIKFNIYYAKRTMSGLLIMMDNGEFSQHSWTPSAFLLLPYIELSKPKERKPEYKITSIINF